MARQSTNVTRVQYDEMQKLHSTLQTIQSDSSISVEERANATRNSTYATNVLFQHAADNRLALVKTHMSPYGHFQTQGNTNFCGLCCINNALGVTATGALPFAATDLDAIADTMWLSMANNTVGLTEELEPQRDREGYYTWEVLSTALGTKGYTCRHIDEQVIVKDISPKEVCANILNHVIPVRLLIRLVHSQHWVTVKVIHGSIILLDSSKPSPRKLTDEQLGQYVTASVKHPGAVCI
jgi:hypothetical protein